MRDYAITIFGMIETAEQCEHLKALAERLNAEGFSLDYGDRLTVAEIIEHVCKGTDPLVLVATERTRHLQDVLVNRCWEADLGCVVKSGESGDESYDTAVVMEVDGESFCYSMDGETATATADEILAHVASGDVKAWAEGLKAVATADQGRSLTVPYGMKALLMPASTPGPAL